MKRLTLSLLFMLFVLNVKAQEKGFIKGKIDDGQFGGPLIGATIAIPALPGVGSTTDFDGNYSISVAPGTYEVKVSYISFSDQIFKDVVVKPGETTNINAVLEMASQEVEMVEVVATVRKNSEAGVLMEMKNATVVSDGLSAQSFRKAGDSDLSGAIRRVTGVTVQDGKYVYVRGLGDRYTKSVLNGMTLPGLDPDVNAVQIDLFPTAVLENVAVSKSFSPDMYGDFTGGLVNVVTKKFPEEKTTQIGLNFTYIPGQHFNKNYILYGRGKTDFLGFDDGSRGLNVVGSINIPDEVLALPITETVTRGFNPELAAKKQFAFMNTSFNFNHGNQVQKEDGPTFGYNFVLRYANERSFLEGFESNDYLRSQDDADYELEKQRTRIGDVGRESVLWNALLTGSMKRNKSSYSATFLYNQSSQSSAAQRMNRDFEQNQATLVEDILTYTQRSLGNFQLTGSHRVGIVEIDWGNSLSLSRVYDPDFRETRISITDGDTTLSTGNGAGIDRFWRDLKELNESFKLDIGIKAHENIKLKVGLANTFKMRDFDMYAFKHQVNNLSNVSINPDWYLQEEQLWSWNPTNPNFRDGTYTISNYEETNQYDAQQNVFAGYIMAEQKLFRKLNLIYGVRLEHTLMTYTGSVLNDFEVLVPFNNRETLNELSVLPALNIVYKVTDKMNLRAGYSRTLARPSFREKSRAVIYDPITKRTFSGNLDLEMTNIDNVDLRYEYFMGGKDMVSLSGFYKRFDGHIEMAPFGLAPDNFKPRNSGIAQVFGGEFEVRKGLRQHTSSAVLQGLFFAANVTVVHSMVDITSVFVDNFGKTEFETRTTNAKQGEVVSKFRQMTGQSPYAVNASLSYQIPSERGNVSLTYNVQGDQLSFVGSGRVPDVYTLAFHSLNFNAYVNLGEKRNSRLSLRVQNLLNDDRTLVYRSYEAQDQTFSTFKPGVSIRLGYQYSF